MSEARILKEVIGLIDFLMRDLENGIPKPNMTDLELQQVLFFNKVFFDNVEEIFVNHRRFMESYEINRLLDLYRLFGSNMIEIVSQMCTRKNWHLELNETFEMDLASLRLSNLTIENVLVLTDGNPDLSKINSGGIYYIGTHIVNDEPLPAIVSVKDIESEFYKPIGFKFNGKTIYWKTDECLKTILEKRGLIGATACRLTTEDGVVTKCEYSGDGNIVRSLTKIFGKGCLLVPTPFVILNDLVGILNHECEEKLKEAQDNDSEITDMLGQDRLIEYPNESFNDSVSFILSAIESPKTVGIYMTLYRIGKDPTILYALCSAVKKGIHVEVNTEILASGETINYFWASELSKIGVNVTFFAIGKLKVHSKIILVQMNDGHFISQISSGNYHTRPT